MQYIISKLYHIPFSGRMVSKYVLNIFVFTI